MRALAVHVLTSGEAAGHTLLPVEQVLESIRELALDPPCRPTKDLLPLLDPVMAPEIVDAAIADGSRARLVAVSGPSGGPPMGHLAR